MLADVCNDDGFPFCQFTDDFNNFLRFDIGLIRLVAKWGPPLVFQDLGCPVCIVCFDLIKTQEHFQGLLGIPYNRNGCFNDLADFSWIDINMGHSGVDCKAIDPACQAVIKAGPNIEDEVCFGQGHVRSIGTMHPSHTQWKLMVDRDGPQTQQSWNYWKLVTLGKGHQFLGSIRIVDPAACQEDWSLGLAQLLENLLNLHAIWLNGRLIARQVNGRVIVGFDDFFLDILGNIDDHRAWTASCGNVDGLRDDAGNILCMANLVIVFGNRSRNPDDICFLEGIFSDTRSGYLTRED